MILVDVKKLATEKQLKYAQYIMKQFKRTYFGGGNSEIQYNWNFIKEYELRIKNNEQLPMVYVSLFIDSLKKHL
jgi:hypothetical protein